MATNTVQQNAYLKAFNDAISLKYDDTHSRKTIYDMFKTSSKFPTLSAVVYEKIAPIDFKFSTAMSSLPADEQPGARKVPAIHAVLNTLNMEQRFKTFSSKLELDKIENGQAIGVESVVANLGASYSDDRTDRFKTMVGLIDSAKSGDEVNAMTTLADVSKFIQRIKYFDFKFKERRTDLYNAYVDPSDSTAKSDTKMLQGVKPICLIDPQKLFKIEGDYYATLFQLQEALPNVSFVEVDNLPSNRFAILIDPRVILWSEFYNELRSEQQPGRPTGDLDHYLFAQDNMGSFNCFNRMVFKTE